MIITIVTPSQEVCMNKKYTTDQLHASTTQLKLLRLYVYAAQQCTVRERALSDATQLRGLSPRATAACRRC
jgi:hypothetical protein